MPDIKYLGLVLPKAAHVIVFLSNNVKTNTNATIGLFYKCVVKYDWQKECM